MALSDVDKQIHFGRSLLKEIVDYDSNGNALYIGWAPINASQFSDAWLIEKNDWTGSVFNGVKRLYGVAWANRTFLTFA